MILAEQLRTGAAPAAAPVRAASPRRDCGERMRLRAEYIERLSEFNEAAALHRIVMRAGMEGGAPRWSWWKFQERCAASREAWARYRRHLAEHGCKHDQNAPVAVFRIAGQAS